MSYKYNLLLILILTGEIGISNLARHDINWENYEDFSMNRGKYFIGRTGVKVYKKDGTESGTIDKSIPNFDGVVDTGNFALWGDSQILSGVYHVTPPDKFTFSKRHFRNDVELFEGYKKLSLDNKYTKFSESIEVAHRQQVEYDYALLRTDRIAFDAYITEGVTKEQWNNIKSGDLVARVGRGLNRVAVDNGKEKDSDKMQHFAGGLNKITGSKRTGLGQDVQISLEKSSKTPLDSGAKKGDSGSPLFWWDDENKKWLIAGSLSRGDAIGGYGRKLYYLAHHFSYENLKKNITDKEITGETKDDVKFENGVLKVDGEERKFSLKENIDINGKSSTKNQIFNKKDLEVKVEGDTNTHAARLEFKEDTTLKGSGTLETAGFVVHKDKTLTYEISSNKDNSKKITVRKIGEGKLVIKSSNNIENLNLGGGETELKNNDGPVAENIRLAQGAKLTITNSNQIKDSNVMFGHRGGTLNLNGNNLEFKDIYHMDKDAKIVNENKGKDDKKATFTFAPKNGKRVFLGSFKGDLDLVYKVVDNDKSSENKSEWSIRSENTDITGKFDIEKGYVKIEGDNVIHGSDDTKSENIVVYEDEYRETKFKSKTINIKNSSTLSVGRATEVDSEINVEEKSTLEMNLLGKVVDRPTPYSYAKTEKEINETVIKGTIDFKVNNKSDTGKTTDDYNFKANIENNHSSTMKANLKGNIKAIKKGSGLLYLENENNSELKGSIDVEGGKLKIKKEETLGSAKTLLKNSSVLEIENNGDGLNNLLDKIDKNSKGVLSLGKDIKSIDTKYKEYSNLYLGSSKDITIGSEDKEIDSSISTLNLGGDNGTVTLKGLDKSKSISKINAGDGKNRGNVVIDKIGTDNSKLDIDVKKGINLKINKNESSNSKIINLGYGASIDSKHNSILNDNSEGVLYLENDSDNIENNDKLALGVAKNKEVTLTKDKSSNSKYYFSGEGKLGINHELKNKELVVDAQYFSGGEVELKQNSENYKGNITITGNKESKNEGNITLKLGSDKALGVNNNVLVKDGGILDLNGKDLEVKIDSNNNKAGSIINKNEKYSTLKVYTENSNLTFNNKLVGNINIEKKGKSAIEFTNEDNKFSEDNKVNIWIKEGQLNYYNSKSLKNANVHIEDGTVLNTKTYQISSEITANGGIIKVNSPTDKGKDSKATNFSKLTLNKDLVVEGTENENKSKVTYSEINLDGNKLTLKNQIVENADIYENVKNNGEVILDNSTYYEEGSRNEALYEKNVNEILYSKSISKITLNNSYLILKDYKSIGSYSNTGQAVDVEVKGNSKITNFRENNIIASTNLKNTIDIKENASLTLSLNDKNDNAFIVNSNIKGKGKLIFEQTNKGNITIKNKFKDFTGSIEVKENSKDKEFKFDINSENEEDRILEYKFISGKYANISSKSIGFKNIKEFTGEISSKGDVLLIGKDGLTTNGKILLKDNKNIIFKADEDSIMDKMNIEGSEKGSSKIVKKGSKNLTINDIETKNIKEFDVDEGTLTIKKEIFNNSDSKYNLKNKTKLVADFINQSEIKSTITGSGDFVQRGSKVTINYKNLNNTGNLELNSELDLKLDNYTTLNQELIGNENGKLNISSSDDNETSELEINKEISKFKGSINLNSANLVLNLKNGVVNNKITGDKVIYNKNDSQLILNNVEEFKGTVESQKGDVLLNFNNKASISKYVIGSGGNIKINSSKDIDLSDKSFENKGDKLLIKLGNSKLSLNANSLNSIKNVSVDEGKLFLNNKNNNNYTEKINASIEVKKDASLEVLDKIYIKLITNSGNILVGDKSLKIAEYTSNGGEFNIKLNEMNKNLLEIEKSDKDVNAKVDISKETLDKIIHDDKKLNVAKIANHNLKITNLEKYESVYELDVKKDTDDIFKIYSMVKINVLNKMYMFNELDLINDMGNELKYRNVIEANYVSYNKIDKDYLKLNNTEYKNKLHSNGVEINFEKANDMSKFKLSGGFNFKILGISLITTVKEKEQFTKILVNIGAVPKLGIKYKFIDANLELGLNTIIVNNRNNKDSLVYLNNSLNVGINPKFKINNDFNIRYLNRVGYKINALIGETKNLIENYNILHKNPISIYYETGVKLEHKYVDFFSKANFEYNFSRYEISNNGQSIENSFKDDWRINIKTGFELKPTEKIYINLDIDANLYQKSYAKYVFKLGMGCNW
ncbi:S6 family peptidase [Streptobacillus notomytis]|uniref:S6 family peptidase n=1 Tax=Streptobacillus notomytis TaxID=1712031 RepID=UPI00093678B9|nr:S6 family peptidase [Streptobacillus notomytis]